MAIYSFSRRPILKAGTAVAVLAHDQGTRVSHGAGGKLHYMQASAGASLDGQIVTDYRGKDVLAVGDSLPDGVIERPVADVFREADAVPSKKVPDGKVHRPVVGSELIAALPHELTIEQNVDLVRDFSKRIANEFGTANAWGIHPPDPGARTEREKLNVHVHMATLHRRIEQDGRLSTINRDFDNRNCWRSDPKTGRQIRETATKRMRSMWENVVNDHLERAGLDVRVDRRTLKEQGIDREPGKHRGAAATRELREQQLAPAVSRESDVTQSREPTPEHPAPGREREVEQPTTDRAHAPVQDGKTPAQVSAMLSDFAKELERKSQAAELRIAEIQEHRRIDVNHSVGSWMGTIEHWQNDALGTFMATMKSADRAERTRSRLKEIAAYRAATVDEAAELKQIGQDRHRANKLLERVASVSRSVGDLDPDVRMNVSDSGLIKKQLPKIEREVKKHRLTHERHRGAEMEMEMEL